MLGQYNSFHPFWGKKKRRVPRGKLFSFSSLNACKIIQKQIVAQNQTDVPQEAGRLRFSSPLAQMEPVFEGHQICVANSH